VNRGSSVILNCQNAVGLTGYKLTDLFVCYFQVVCQNIQFLWQFFFLVVRNVMETFGSVSSNVMNTANHIM
jgi:hypothetical protein